MPSGWHRATLGIWGGKKGSRFNLAIFIFKRRHRPKGLNLLLSRETKAWETNYTKGHKKKKKKLGQIKKDIVYLQRKNLKT